MCGICNKIGIRHENLNLQESSPALTMYKDATSSSTTLNFNEGNNIIIPSEDGSTLRGLTGNDTYIISSKTIKPNSKIKIVDTEGKNIIQLVDGLIISDSIFSKNATRLSLSNGSEITINGADKFTFELSGNLTTGTLGVNKTFSEFAIYMGLEVLPSSGSDKGNKNITIQSSLDADNTSATIEARALQKDLSNLPLKNFDKIQSNQKIEINLKDFFSVPKVSPTGSTDLSLLTNLEDINVIIFEKTDTYATLSLKENIEGMEVLDLNFLNIDEGSLKISQHYYNAYYRVIEDPPDQGYNYYWRDADKQFIFFELKDNILSLYGDNYIKETGIPDSDAEYTEAQFYYKYTDDKGEISKFWMASENFKVKLSYKSKGIEKEYIVSLDSVFNDADEISTYKDKINSLPSLTSIEFEIQDNSHPFFTRDQILLDGSKLSLKGGVDSGEVFPVYFKVRASVINSDGYEYINPEDGYKDLELTIMMTDDDYIRTKSSKIIEINDNETSISIIEDTPGDILLDLSDFNIDPGTAKIKTVKINHWEDYEPFEPYISETFYIDEKVLKFTEGTLYDYDSDQLSWIRYTKNNEENNYGSAYRGGTYPTLDVRDDDFEITFIYKSNNEEFEHVLKIVEYENTTYGSAFSSDYYLTYSNETTDNKYINALNIDTRLPHLKAEKESYLMEESEWTNYETTITYTFLDPAKDQYHGLGGFKDTEYYQPYINEDIAHAYNDVAKNMILNILDMTSEIFKITFEEVDYEKAQIKFSLYTSTNGLNLTNYANYPSNTPGNHVLVGDESNFVDSDWFSINPGGYTYNVAVHELGHNLGLSHPFAGYPDTSGYAESYYANSLFTVMAYASFWSKDIDIYEFNSPDTFSSYTASISGILKEDQYGLQDIYSIDQLGWGRDDLLTLAYMYGLRENYKSTDTIYSWSIEENLYETIHDMGGNDTIDLSNYVWDMDIDLNPGSVSEVGVGQERMHWNSLRGEKTGDIFILSWETTIENYIGSTGSNTVTLNNKISNNIDLRISEDENIINNAITSDIILGSSYEDYFYVVISNLEEINESISIDGGPDSDWLIIEAPEKLNSLKNIDAIEISKNNDKALIALKENIKKIEVLDLNFLSIDEGSLEISQYYYNSFYKVIEDPPVDGVDYYWWDVDKSFTFFELKDDILSLSGENYIIETGIPDSYAEYTEAQFYFTYFIDGKGEIVQSWFPTENFKVKLSYTSEGIEKEYIVEIDSIYNNETPYSEYFEPEENLDLDFNLTDLLTHFDNIENFDFTNNEKNTITITEDTFQLSNKTKIKGDENDEISLPQDAVQTSSDDLYLYYSLNEIEIGISVDLILI